MLELYTVIQKAFTEAMPELANENASLDSIFALADAHVYDGILEEFAARNNSGEYDYCDYVLYDIDFNNNAELLLRYSDGSDGYTNVYTYTDGAVNLIGEFWSRYRILLDGTGNIYTNGSGGAMYNSVERMQIADDGKSFEIIERWESDLLDDYTPFYTHTTESGTETITEDEFFALYDISNDYIDTLDWQPVSEETDANVDEQIMDARYLAGFLGRPKQDIIDAFGEPDYDVEWFMSYEDKFDVIYDNQAYPYAVYSIAGITPSMVEVDGVTLDKTKDELFSVFYYPVREYYDEGYGDTWTYGHNVCYNFGDFSVTVSSEEDGGKPYSVCINAPIEESYDGYYEDSYDDGGFVTADGYAIYEGAVVYRINPGPFGINTSILMGTVSSLDSSGNANVDWYAVISYTIFGLKYEPQLIYSDDYGFQHWYYDDSGNKIVLLDWDTNLPVSELYIDQPEVLG
jgi:hypothetical protein